MELYFNGKFLKSDGSFANAMLVNNEFIIDIGDYHFIKQTYTNIDQYINLENKLVLPAFIDPHSHLMSLAMNYLQVDLSSAKKIEDIQTLIAQYIKKFNVREDEFITCFNYEHNELDEKRHPYDEEISMFKNPIVLKHRSNHFGVFNKAAQEKLHLNTDKGYLQETEFVNALKQIPIPNIKKILDLFDIAQQEYLKNGITIVQEGMLVKEMIDIYKAVLFHNKLYLNVFAYSDINAYPIANKELSNISHFFYLDGLKIILDGSPQGRTAYVSHPYEGSNDCSSILLTKEEIKAAIELALKENKALLIHANGDQAIKDFIKVCKEFPLNDIRKIRIVLIHAQLLDVNDLDDIASLNIITSYFVNHIYHYGDIHLKNLGTRGLNISPLKSTLNHHVLYTLHTDTPVIEPNLIESIYCAVNRKNKYGFIHNEKESLSVLEAINGVTINVAKQYNIDQYTGSLEKDKYADFIILNQDIFTIDKEKIKDTIVLRTYKNGKLLYQVK